MRHGLCERLKTLGRQWVGIDLSELAASLVKTRPAGSVQAVLRGLPPRRHPEANGPWEAPRATERTSITCSGSKRAGAGGVAWPSSFATSQWDHVVPQSQGGSDHLDNLQLLCGACNSVKGDRPHAALLATLKDRGILS